MIGITNATLVSIAPPPVPDSDGGRTLQSPVAVTDDVFVDAVTKRQIDTHGAKIADASAVMFAPEHLDDLLVTDARVTFKPDGRPERTLQIAHTVDRNKAGGLAHVETYLKRV